MWPDMFSLTLQGAVATPTMIHEPLQSLGFHLPWDLAYIPAKFSAKWQNFTKLMRSNRIVPWLASVTDQKKEDNEKDIQKKNSYGKNIHTNTRTHTHKHKSKKRKIHIYRPQKWLTGHHYFHNDNGGTKLSPSSEIISWNLQLGSPSTMS